MKKPILISLIVGASLLVVGGTLLTVGLVTNVKSLETITNTHQLEESFSNFNIDVTTSEVEFKVSPDGTKKVTTDDAEKYYHKVSIKDDILTIEQVDDRAWYEKMFGFNGFHFYKIKTAVYLPAGLYNELKIDATTGSLIIPNDFSFNKVNVNMTSGRVSLKTDINDYGYVEATTGEISLTDASVNNLTISATTGNILLTDVSANVNINVSLTTGNIKLTNVTAKNVDLSSTTGDVTLKNTIISERLKIETTTGDVNLTDSDAGTIYIETTTGDVKGTLLTSKIFSVYTTTGSVKVPNTTTGGLCEIRTTTGSVNIQINS